MNGTRFWHVGLTVQNIEATMDELTRTLGLTWGKVNVREDIGVRQRVVYSEQGPPYFQLVEGEAGSHWDGAKGSRLDHLAFWVEDFEGERDRLVREGAPIAVDGPAVGLRVTYHTLEHSGFSAEILAAGEFMEQVVRMGDLPDPGPIA